MLSTSVARPLVEIFFGRIDARTVTSEATGKLLEQLLPGRLRADRAGGRVGGRGGSRRPAGATGRAVADDFEAVYRRILARRHDPTGDPELRAKLAEPAADRGRPAHAHRPLRRLRDAGRGAAADGPRPRPRGDRDHRPQRGRGALEAAAVAESMAGPEGDRRRGGEDRRAGRGDRPLPQGEDPEGADDGGNDRRDPRAGRPGLRAAPVRPLPLGARLRAPARHRRGSRPARGLQPAGGADRLQRGGGAVRGQVPDHPGGRLGLARRPGAGERAPADPRLRRARPSSSRRCGTPTSPASTRTWSTSRP